MTMTPDALFTLEGTLYSALAWFGTWLVSDFVYTLDHYLVHHDQERYLRTHARHHVRYGRTKNAPQLDAYELSTYGTAAIMSCAATSVLSLITGNPGFFLGAASKFAHSLLLHLYQHRWWGKSTLRSQRLGRPRRGWGLASARYHAFHHSDPSDETFTYAESWAGFDRLLERFHPSLVRLTVDHRVGRASAACALGEGGGVAR